MLKVLWIGGWAHSLERYSSQFQVFFPEFLHVFVDVLEQICPTQNNSEKLHQILIREQPHIIVGWSLGSLYWLAQSNQNYPSIHRVILLNPIVNFCKRPGGWPLKVIQKMQEELQRDPQKVILSFLAQVFSKSVSIQSLSQLEQDLSLKFSSNHISLLDPFIQGLDFLSQTKVSLKSLSLANPTYFFPIEDDPISPPIEEFSQNLIENPQNVRELSSNLFYFKEKKGGHFPFKEHQTIIQNLLKGTLSIG